MLELELREYYYSWPFIPLATSQKSSHTIRVSV
jgi:hypothetical protein